YAESMSLTWLQGRMLIIVCMRITYTLREDIERKRNRLPTNWFEGTQRGDLLSRPTNDVDNMQTAVQQTVSQLLTGLLTIIGITIMMIAIPWRLALSALIAVPHAAAASVMHCKR